MALNGSGPISLGGATAGQSINLENGQSATAQVSLNDSAVRTLAGVPSGVIVMPTNFWGKSNLFSFTITSATDVNLRTNALAAGWNGSSALIATIPGGNTITASSTGAVALTISGSFPGGVTLINNGLIIGRGGDGGAGAVWQNTGSPGNSGGVALSVSSAVSINNGSGVIAGGGGGGGGGGSGRGQYSKFFPNSSGGGGGGGIGISSGGLGGVAVGTGGRAGTNGTGGSTSTAGTGGVGGTYPSTSSGGTGGNGGSYGSGGATGGSGSGNIGGTGGGAGGAAGACTSGNSNITWIATGTRYGALN